MPHRKYSICRFKCRFIRSNALYAFSLPDTTITITIAFRYSDTHCSDNGVFISKRDHCIGIDSISFIMFVIPTIKLILKHNNVTYTAVPSANKSPIVGTLYGSQLKC